MERKWKWRPKQHGSGDPKKVDMSARKTVGVEFAKKMWAGKGMEVWKAIGSGVRQASGSGFRKEIGGGDTQDTRTCKWILRKWRGFQITWKWRHTIGGRGDSKNGGGRGGQNELHLEVGVDVGVEVALRQRGRFIF